MFLFYVLTFFKKGGIIQGGTLFKGGHYLRKYGMLVKTYVLKNLILQLRPTTEGQRLTGLNIRPKVKITARELSQIRLHLGWVGGQKNVQFTT